MLRTLYREVRSLFIDVSRSRISSRLVIRLSTFYLMYLPLIISLTVGTMVARAGALPTPPDI
jgi:hypothetical protein